MSKGEDIRDKEHAFNVGIAMKYGIPAALLYREIKYWCDENASREQNVRDGCAWMYRSLSEFQEYFPELSDYSIRHALETLIAAGLILESNYRRQYRTKWYTTQVDLFVPDKQPHLSKSTNGVLDSTNGMSDSTNGMSDSTNAFVESNKCNVRNQQMHLSDSTEHYNLDNSSGTPSVTPSGRETGQENWERWYSTAGAASSTRQAPPSLSQSHLTVIQERTIGFKMEQLLKLIELGDSERDIAINLITTIPKDKPWPWGSVFRSRLEKLERRKKATT